MGSRKNKKNDVVVAEPILLTGAVAEVTPEVVAEPEAAPIATETLGPTKADKPKAPKGVSFQKTRAYYAGVVVRRVGLAHGITDAMADEVDALVGRANTIESNICLRNAWQVIRACEDAAS